MALLDDILVQKKSLVLLSTHHQQLKAQAHQNPLIQSAHMIFDNDSLKPLYKISLDGPGPSYAFEIFERMAPQLIHIAQKARNYQSKNTRNYESLLTEMAQKIKEIHLQKIKLEDQNKKLESELKNKQSLQYLEMEKEKELFDKEIRKAKEKIQEIIQSAKSQPQSLKRLIQQVEQNSHIAVMSRSETTKHPTVPLSKIHLNQFYHSHKLKSKVKVLAINEKKLQLQVLSGKIKAWVPLDDLSEVSQPIMNKQPQFKSSYPAISSNLSSFDLRGLRLDDFITRVEEALLMLKNEALQSIEIIHGHGDGVLKNWLRQHLNQKKDFYQWHAPQHSQDGSTVILLN